MNGPIVLAIVALGGIAVFALVIGLDTIADRIVERRRDRSKRGATPSVVVHDETRRWAAEREGFERGER